MTEKTTAISPSRGWFSCDLQNNRGWPFHLSLCGRPENHGHPFPDYLRNLQQQHARVVAELLSVEDDPGERERRDLLDSTAQQIWNQIQWLAEQGDPYHGVTKIEDWELQEISAEISTPLSPPDHFNYKAIKAKADIVEWIGKHTTLRRVGRSFKGKCPLPDHKDDSPSLNVYPDTQSWWCFGCRRGRDIFDFELLMNDRQPHEIAL